MYILGAKKPLAETVLPVAWSSAYDEDLWIGGIEETKSYNFLDLQTNYTTFR